MLSKKRYSLQCLFILALFLITNNAFSQRSKPLEVDMQIVTSVKKDVWIPFMEAYRDLDSKKLISIHTPDITRVSINSNKIESGAAYLESIESLFQRVKKMNREMSITFSIVSSATTENKVYQTGYYVFSSRAKGEGPFIPRGYSSFNVILTKDKESGTWKISLDADKQIQFTQDEFMKSGTIYTIN